ncbi:MAG TPA: hypothetical protein VE177_03760 [Candidatus Binatus sp.]|nr:hypothetical protein [Candidatus Binatus sp.]
MSDNDHPQQEKLRFRIRRRDYEIELEGNFDYVKEKFESIAETFQHHLKQEPPLSMIQSHASIESGPSQISSAAQQPPPELLAGIIQFSNEGRPHLTVQADRLTAKEALALVLYATHPKPLGDDDLSGMLGSSWKTTSGAVVRARASELKREGKLIAEKGSYILSGAGIQWVTGDLIPDLRKTA